VDGEVFNDRSIILDSELSKNISSDNGSKFYQVSENGEFQQCHTTKVGVTVITTMKCCNDATDHKLCGNWCEFFSSKVEDEKLTITACDPQGEYVKSLNLKDVEITFDK